MVKLKERYGEDRQAFSQAMMDLYKKEGANPLGGCFPILSNLVEVDGEERIFYFYAN